MHGRGFWELPPHGIALGKVHSLLEEDPWDLETDCEELGRYLSQALQTEVLEKQRRPPAGWDCLL